MYIMPWKCAKPYDRTKTTNIKERAKSCKKTGKGKYGNRQSCVEKCYKNGNKPKRKPKAVKRYKNNAFNRRIGRVGQPLGSKCVSWRSKYWRKK